MSDPSKPSDSSRRTALGLTIAAGTVGTVAVAVPFGEHVAAERAKAAGAPVEVDLSDIKPGEMKRTEWRGKPVWILRRTQQMLETLKTTDTEVADPDSTRTAFPTPDWAQNEYRSIKPEYLVLIGICTHLGCVPLPEFDGASNPSLPADWVGGFLPVPRLHVRPGRSRIQEQAAPDNLEVPPTCTCPTRA